MILVGELLDGQATIWCKNIPEKLNSLSRVHGCHRRQTDGFLIALAISHVWLKVRLVATNNSEAVTFMSKVYERDKKVS